MVCSDSAASRLQSPGRGKEEKEEEKLEPHTGCFRTAPLTVSAKHLCADLSSSLCASPHCCLELALQAGRRHDGHPCSA